MAQQGASAPMSGFDCLDTSAGFFIAPFDCASLPALIIRPDMIRQQDSANIPRSVAKAVDECCGRNSTAGSGTSPDRADYAADFAAFHDSLLRGTFSKLVLSRKAIEPRRADTSPVSLFAEACSAYPRLFIALFSAPQCGTWLVATPELLVSRHGCRCHTMALAGTMPFQPGQPADWSRKNTEEQQFVTSYILDSISPFATDVSVKGPFTARAGGLVHLRSQISFAVPPCTSTSRIVEALHPTPAICGLPKQEALRFILATEHSPRLYYSGFCGPCYGHGDTDLYVSLRCMRICRPSYELYAGGGILKASEEGSEWRETEGKMLTMRRLIKSQQAPQ